MARIGMNAGMELRVEQQMLLQPRMLQSIQVLQMPTWELDGWLFEQAEGNEALLVEAAPPDLSPRGTREDSEAHDEMLRNQPAPGRSLHGMVAEQLATAGLEGGVEEWVRFLVDCLDPRGFLSADDGELLALAQEAGLEGGEAQLARGLAALQGLEPRGVGARGAIEALLLQLDPADPDYGSLCRLLEEFVEELAKNHMPQVARAMGLELADLERLLALLAELDPAPVATLAGECAPAIVPDVLVERSPEGWEVSVPRSRLPAVSVDPEVRSLARDQRQDSAVRRYLRGRLDQARWIVEAVAQRRATLLRVARAVFVHQRPFLEEGPGHLTPLTMGQIADELSLHVSTISRAVAGKYAQTPWGVLPLRRLFQSAAGGESARDDVRRRVRALFEAEDKGRPLSDDELVGLLAQEGVKVARRTVAKYRAELGIPSSYRRRRFSE